MKYSYLEGRLVFFFESHNIGSSLNMFMKRGAALYLLTLSRCVLVSCILFTLQVLYSRDHLSSSLHGVTHKGILSMTNAEGNTNNNISWLGAYRGYHYYKTAVKALMSSQEL